MKKILQYSALIIGIILLINFCSTDNDSDKKLSKENDLKWSLWNITQNQVKNKLAAPATANFHLNQSIDNTVSIYQINPTDTLYLVKGSVDSQNSFGALLTSKFECKLSVSNNEIYLKSLDFY